MKWFDNIDVIDIVSAVIATPIVIAASPIIIAKVAYDSLTEDTSPPPPQTPSWNKPTIVIGPKGSGKTTLANLLAEQKIDETQPTMEKTTVGSKISDYPGDEHCVNTEWAEAIKGRFLDTCIYVFNLKSYDDNIIYENHNYQKLVLWHIDLIDDWIKQKNSASSTVYFSQTHLIVIGTHSDELEAEAPNRILNEIRLELTKRSKDILIRQYDLKNMTTEKLIDTIIKG